MQASVCPNPRRRLTDAVSLCDRAVLRELPLVCAVASRAVLPLFLRNISVTCRLKNKEHHLIKQLNLN
ncbi:hypothetical protein Csa_022709 [Cucumis sativus]|uniref:Uncharacterized protein n=1 Tax=Cucumis sativus TaxID=3659 RepID=A0A0A0LVG7_CUCSA|nr:hypothetical protein Csa_022709 [Cucumis sativus]